MEVPEPLWANPQESLVYMEDTTVFKPHLSLCVPEQGSPLEWAGRLEASLWSRVGGGKPPAWKCVGHWASCSGKRGRPWTHCLWAGHCTGDPCRWQGWLQEELAVGRGSYPFQLGELAAKRWACSTGRRPRQGHPWDPGQRPSQGPSPPFPPRLGGPGYLFIL